MPSNSLAFDRAAGYYDRTRGFPPGVAEEAVAVIIRAVETDNSFHAEAYLPPGRDGDLTPA